MDHVEGLLESYIETYFKFPLTAANAIRARRWLQDKIQSLKHFEFLK